jgi:hypothetical protein
MPSYLEVKLDRASKYYNPGETVTGMFKYDDGTPQVQHQGLQVTAKAYLDTVSIIRGSYGREALKEEERIYFMN